MARRFLKHFGQSVLLALFGPLLGATILFLVFPGMQFLLLFGPFFILYAYYVGFVPSLASAAYLLHAAKTQRPMIAILSSTVVGALSTLAWVGWNFELKPYMTLVAIGCGAGAALIVAVFVVAASERKKEA